ncbi:PIN domain-containing protein [Laspinema olomoucense]|uniref:PIN domain-containing protein n=1 Tax=Laspinema olomoucense D3b TaxID=2953688 RepID=A0ABT2N8P6_9CYAN|nr:MULTISPECIES: PIN domain-containing protein [unclassified Laspinema]MCT7978224.1 hypothetical protein [Laspinema sp. D3b]MCT7995813.1 hypothetical protein [Laspinema sp. D3c]
MSARPQILLVFDTTSLLAGDTKVWKDYKRVGSCFVPNVVFEAMQDFADSAAEPGQEKAAKEFMRFWPKSGWQQTTATATHRKLTPPEGAALSSTARLSLEIAEAAYGVALEREDAIVVFVCNGQPLLKRIAALRQNNLCGITSAMLLQWSRANKEPEVVTQQVERREESDDTSGMSTASQARSPSKSHKKAPASRKPAAKRPAAAKRPKPIPIQEEIIDDSAYALQNRRHGFYVKPKKSNIFAQLSTALVALVMAAFMITVLGFMWKMAFPETFNPFWQKQIQPQLKKLPPIPGVS